MTLKRHLESLKPQLAAAAQKVYDEWDEDDYGGGGICDDVSAAMSDVIANSASNDPDILDGGHEGDDHAWLIVRSGNEAYSVDIPSYVYERGGGYSWSKIPGVKIRPSDVEIFPVDARYL